MAPCVYLSPEFALFFWPRTGGNKNALEVPCHPHCRGRATQNGIFVIGGGCTCFLLISWISCEFSCFPLSLVELSPAEAKYT